MVANEYDAARANILRSNLERMGAANAVVLNEAPARIAAALPGWFDRVLVDAPCSGEGMFRKEPQALRQHSEALVRRCASLGAQILDAAAAALRPGGRLVYSTCTFAPEEDETQIGAFLQRHAGILYRALQRRVRQPGEAARCGGHPFRAQDTRRIYPCHGGEGHFMAVLEKCAGAAQPGRAARSFSRQARTAGAGRGGAPQALAFLREYFPRLAAGPEALTPWAAPCTCWRPAPFRTARRCAWSGVPVGKEEKGPVRARARAVHGLWRAV